MVDFDWTEEAEKQWNERASSWNSKSKEMWETGSRKDVISFFKSHVSDGKSVCDLGCGDGYGSFKLASSGYHVTGMDVSHEMIERAKSLEKASSLQFVKGDIAILAVPDSHFDAIIAINSLEWTENPLSVLLETKRIVKKEGYACFGILGPTAMPRVNSYQRLYGEQVICNTMMPWEFEKLASENGFSKVAEYGVYKRGADQLQLGSLSTDLKQALSFIWVFMFQLNNKH
ncbi:class I SAM-dependent methyltransferase [Bacillus sp. 1NLA3E]|uniref:class I SAM-dependent methyltransferase n=1 Tax=Bacillus sp. 1NLA3E TaxID=666686 RepID=UPI000247F3C0|nr:class I SAM-dependent methyltransferase [Bacillus sp. 1NLA3E]AGK54623.1 type 11 methyltransferase [Bacillus sp. 1NLA3E]